MIDRNLGSRAVGTFHLRTGSGHTGARAAPPDDVNTSMRALRRMSVGQRAVGVRGQKLLPGITLTKVQPTTGKRGCAGSASPVCGLFPACGTCQETDRRAQGTGCSVYAELLPAKIGSPFSVAQIDHSDERAAAQKRLGATQRLRFRMQL